MGLCFDYKLAYREYLANLICEGHNCKGDCDNCANSEIKDCSTCVMYQWHTYDLPEKINTKRRKHWDDVLTATCNSCTTNNPPNYHNVDECELNDQFIEKLELKLKRVKNDSKERNVSKKHY